MSEWQDCELGEIAKIQTGPFGSQLKNEQYITGGTPVVTVEHIKNFRIDNFTYPSVSLHDKERLARYLLNEGDIIFTRVGSVDLSAYVQPHQHGWMFSSRMLRVRPDQRVDSRFLSYFFQQKSFRDYILNISVGATMPSINTEILKGIPISYPNLPEQKAIAAVLSSLDDKIDLLHRQNQTLEAMAETLFRQWFIDEAVNQSENQLLLGELIESVSVTHKFKTNTINFLNTSDIYKGNVLNNEEVDIISLPGQAKKSIQKEDILFSEIRPANGRYAYINFDAENYVVSTKLMVLRSKGILSQAFVYFYLTNSQTVDWLQMLAESRSGTFPQITFDQLKDLKINIPSESILNHSISWCESVLQKLNFNSTQIQTLETLRDTLLPKLMSGEVRLL